MQSFVTRTSPVKARYTPVGVYTATVLTKTLFLDKSQPHTANQRPPRGSTRGVCAMKSRGA